MAGKYPPLKERLLKATTINESGCWICTIGHGRYGRVKLDGTGIGLKNHRASWMVHKGPIPEGKCVLHTCDTPRCINPDHLFLGSHADNMADRAAKGRNADQRGEKGPGTYLTADKFLRSDLYGPQDFILRLRSEICAVRTRVTCVILFVGRLGSISSPISRLSTAVNAMLTLRTGYEIRPLLSH